jgi:hypothetical protein
MMKFAKFSGILVAVFGCLAIEGQAVRAEDGFTTTTYTVPQSAVLPIELRPGLGTNLIFEGVNQSIETIFLDNMSFVSMNHNGCIEKGCPPRVNAPKWGMLRSIKTRIANSIVLIN